MCCSWICGATSEVVDLMEAVGSLLALWIGRPVVAPGLSVTGFLARLPDESPLRLRGGSAMARWAGSGFAMGSWLVVAVRKHQREPAEPVAMTEAEGRRTTKVEDFSPRESDTLGFVEQKLRFQFL